MTSHVHQQYIRRDIKFSNILVKWNLRTIRTKNYMKIYLHLL